MFFKTFDDVSYVSKSPNWGFPKTYDMPLSVATKKFWSPQGKVTKKIRSLHYSELKIIWFP